ncbi:hypothetical protein pipiens_013507 [Culex pipiens pipiens]|uniref:Small ribosomal subunit protein uS10 domain-containing protein n=1 Tax=Culex pipiens pipiens TaxID=38569 RepID=A0ABD1CY84_CULPP
MAATRKDIEKAATLHRNRVTLTLRNVRSLEKLCADLISGAKKQKLRVKGPMRLHKRIIDLHSPSEIVKQITSINIKPGVEVKVTIADP